MDINLEDTMPTGKHKSRKIKDIYKDDAEYLVWFRQTRKDQNQDTRYFSLEVSALLDMTIEASPQLQKKYKPWNLSAVQAALRVVPTAPSAATVEYQAWGQF